MGRNDSEREGETRGREGWRDTLRAPEELFYVSGEKSRVDVGERWILFLKFYELCVGVAWLCSALSLSLKHTQKVTWHPLYACVYMSVG